MESVNLEKTKTLRNITYYLHTFITPMKRLQYRANKLFQVRNKTFSYLHDDIYNY